MKKKLSLLMIALVTMAAFAFHQSQRRAEAVTVDVPTETELGAFITEQIAANPGAPITLKLAAGGSYTMTTDCPQLPVDAAFAITSDAANPATITWANKPIRGGKGLTIENVIIDASAASGHIVSMNKPNAETWGEGQASGNQTYWTLEPYKFENVKILGLVKCILMDANDNGRFIFPEIVFNKCTIELRTGDDSKNVPVNISYGAVEKFTLANSTVYSKTPTTTYSNFLQLGGTRIWKAPGYESTAEAYITFENNTFYEVSLGGKMLINSNAYKGQAQAKFIIKKNIFANTPDVSKKIYKNITNASNAANQITAENNTYIIFGEGDPTYWNEVDLGSDEGIQDNPGFKDAANGDFTLALTSAQNVAKTGDPRWIQYSVTIADGIQNGTVVADVAAAKAGETVTLTATPAEGYELDAISVRGVTSDELVGVNDGKFTMPADAVTVSATFKPAPVDVDIAAADIIEGNITAAIATKAAGVPVKNLTITLAENTAYTVSAPIEAGGNVTITGAAGATIDASGLAEGAFVLLSKTPAVGFQAKNDGSGNTDYYGVGNVTIKDVKVTGLKNSIFYDNNTKYVVLDFTIANSVFELATAAVNNEALIAFQAGGAKDFTVKNSTIYGNNAVAKYFLRYNNSSRIDRYGFVGADDTWSFTYENNTFYGLLKSDGQWGNYNGVSQKAGQLVLTVKNNIWVDCDAQTMRRLNQSKNFSNFNAASSMANNIFNREGAVVDQGNYGNGSDLNGVVTFTNAAEGDFNAQLGVALAPTEPTVAVGDPRWTVTAVQVPVDIVISPADGDIAAALTAATEGKLVKNITINLTKDVTYTLGASIIAPNSLVINGNGATIDASSLTSPFVALAAEPTASFLPKNDGSGNSEYYGVEKVSISGVKVTGLKQSIFWDSNVKYCVVDFKIENSVFALATEAVSNEALIAFQAGGAKDFTVKNSTIYGNNAVAKYFLRYNNSSRIDRYGFVGADDTWSFTYENNTFYGLLKSDGQWGNYNGVSQKAGQLVLTVKNNIWVDCDAQTMRRLNQSKNFSNFNAASSMANNIFNREGAVVDQGNYGNGSDLKGTVVFTDAAVGNFNADVTVFGSTELPAVGDPRWTVTYERAGITLWSSEEPATIVWDQQNIAIPAEKFANAKVGDVIRVVLQDVPTAATNIWDAQVELRGQNWKALEASLLVAGTATEAAKTVAEFVLTGDILAIAKEMGVQFNGANCKTSLIMLDYAEEVAGSDASVWVGSATKSNVSINKAHFANFNNFTGIKVGDKIRVTVKKTDAEKDCWIGMNYNNTSWQWSDFAEGSFVATSTETADGVITEFEVETEDAAKIMNEDNVAVFVNNPNQTVTQVELIAAPEAPKFYIIGLNGNWDRTNMIEMTRNESGRYEYEFTTETQAFFAFADKQMTAEEAEADSDWSVFNSFRYSLGDGDVEYTQLGEIKSLVKGAANGTITLKPGTFKITVEPDFNAVTITGEFAPEPQPVTVDKLFIMGTGTPKGWEGTTELTFNEATQAFEYEATVTEDTYLTFGDAEFTSWPDFNGKHRFALAEGNTDAVLDQAVQLVLVNDGCVVLKNAGTYKISVTKDLKMTITAAGTGINSIAADKMKNATIYNVSGQRVEKAQKGLYIINGRKVVIK